MQQLAATFVEHGLSTLRFNFPYMQMGQRRVDNKSRAVATISLQLSNLPSNTIHFPFFSGWTQLWWSHGAPMQYWMRRFPVPVLIFCSFPLHPPKKPGQQRALHLPEIAQPMLFLSGTRDDLADSTLLTENRVRFAPG